MTGAIERIKKYLHQRSLSRSYDGDIHGLHPNDDREAILTTYDITEIITTLESLQRENEELLAENGELRNIVSNCADALLTGAFVSPKCSVDFMKDVPKEIASTVGALRDRLEIGPHGEDAIDVAESAADNLRHRVEAAEAQAKRLREALEAVLAAHDIKSVKGELLENVIASATDRARTALASTGGEHNGN